MLLVVEHLLRQNIKVECFSQTIIVYKQNKVEISQF